MNNVRPPRHDAGWDVLIFKPASAGVFSFKKAYESIIGTRHGVDLSIKKVWDLIWKKGTIVLRVRLFLWKLMHKVLPLAGILASKISSIDPTCVTCGLGVEHVQHIFFTCPFSRACWFSNPLNLRSDYIGDDLVQGLKSIIDHFSEEQWTTFANITWSIWRCRNDGAFGGKQPSIQSFYKYLNDINSETRLAEFKHKPVATIILNETFDQTEYKCYVDGSWLYGWQAGIGIILMKGNELFIYKSKAIEACCPLQVETMALREAIHMAKEWNVNTCSFYSNCKSLVGMISSKWVPIDTDWRAYHEVQDTWKILQDNEGYTCKHIARSHNELADLLAKQGRIED